MERFKNILSSLNNIETMHYFPKIGIANAIEIIIIAVILYSIIKNIKGTRAWVLMKGVITLLVLYTIVYALNLSVLVSIFQSALLFIGIAIVVTIQPELRRMIEKIGTKNINTSLNNILRIFFKPKMNAQSSENWISDNTIQELVKGCSIMSKAKTGVLIVIEREVPLNEYIDSGIKLNADITSALLINTFEKNTPLHDGAVIIRHDQLTAATCYLPLSDNPSIDKDLGTRHRAGIGISECTDAVVVIVSEETGAISFVQGGEIKHNIDREGLDAALRSIQNRASNEGKVKKGDDLRVIAGRNIHLKILSLAGAAILWMMVITTLNPVISTTLRNIPIQTINTELITETGKTYEIIDGETVNVTIRDRKDIVDRISASDIKVIADFSKLSYVNSIPLEFTYNGDSDITLSKSTMSISLEDMITAEVNIEVEHIGEAPEGHYISSVELDSNTIVVSGAKSVINTIGNIVVQIDDSKFTSDRTVNLSPIIYDKNGNQINKNKLELNKNNISADVRLYNTKEIPITIKPIIENTVLQTIITDITCQESTITVTGNEELLNTYQNIEIEAPINIALEDLTQQQFIKTMPIQAYLDENYTGLIVLPQSAKISLDIQFADFYTTVINFNSKDIAVDGLKNNLDISIESIDYSIDVVGLSKNVEEKDAHTIKPYINVSNLGIGEYEIPILYRDTSIEAFDNALMQIKIIEKAKE